MEIVTDEELSENESVIEQGDHVSWPSNSSFTSLADDEDRTSYLTRQGLSAVLECEDQQHQGLVYQENIEYAPQLKRLDRETKHHVKVVKNYFIEPTLKMFDDGIGLPCSVENVSVKQLEKSLRWLETIDPELGQSCRQELLSDHKDRFEMEKLESEKVDLEALIESRETNLTSSESNQRYQHQQASSLDNLTCVVSGKIDWYWQSIGVKFGPQIRLERGGSSSFNLGFTCTFDQTNTNREGGVAVSLSGNKGHLETAVESRLSKKGSEHKFTAQVNNLVV
jgi:hypothetical protein